MDKRTLNRNMNEARAAKKDEFYTELKDIEEEMHHYWGHFLGKTIYLNCDNPEISNFWKYFSDYFELLGLKKLISTYFSAEGVAYKTIKTLGANGQVVVEKILLEGDGDFRSPECIEIMGGGCEDIIVVSNPPFSLFREYIDVLMDHGVDFLVLGNMNAITCKNIFGYIYERRLWTGVNNGTKAFRIPDSYHGGASGFTRDGAKFAKLSTVWWFTNMETGVAKEPLELVKSYTPEKYPEFDNYKAINVNKVSDIPKGYDGVMGVPINFFSRWNPEQFDIVDANILKNPPTTRDGPIMLRQGKINGKTLYQRIAIMRKIL